MTPLAGFLMVNLAVLSALATGALSWWTPGGDVSFATAFMAVNAAAGFIYWNRRRGPDLPFEASGGGDWGDGCDFDIGCGVD